MAVRGFEIRRPSHYRVCDYCGGVDILRRVRGRWICEDCEDEARKGDRDYWRWHHHEAGGPLDYPEVDYDPYG